MGWECFCEVGFDLGPLLKGGTRILHLQYFFKYVLTYFLHLNSYLVTFLHNTICRAQVFCPSVSFGISFEHAVQLPFTVLLYSTFPDNYAFLSSPSQIKNTQSADTVPVHRHSPLVFFSGPYLKNGLTASIQIWHVVVTSFEGVPYLR